MHYFDKNGQVCAAKVKTKDKDFWMEGNNTDSQLFGQNLFPDRGTRLTIYEGELRCSSGWEAQPNWLMYPYQMVQRLQEALQRVLDLLQNYEEVSFIL